MLAKCFLKIDINLLSTYKPTMEVCSYWFNNFINRRVPYISMVYIVAYLALYNMTSLPTIASYHHYKIPSLCMIGKRKEISNLSIHCGCLCQLLNT